MNFKPFSKKYDFSDSALVMDFPPYFSEPINIWLWKILDTNNVTEYRYENYSHVRYIESDFRRILQIDFREKFPGLWSDFFRVVYSDTDCLCNMIAYCLQKFGDSDTASNLEKILSTGGSGYEVKITKLKNGSNNYDLMERVSPIVKQQSEKALSENDILTKAWQYCYSRNPDYDKAVIECQNFLEGFLRNRYDLIIKHLNWEDLLVI
jgi:hypothetical protein